jgi:hypothetical protein
MRAPSFIQRNNPPEHCAGIVLKRSATYYYCKLTVARASERGEWQTDATLRDAPRVARMLQVRKKLRRDAMATDLAVAIALPVSSSS